MRKISKSIFVILFFVGQFLIFTPSATAALTGCPDSWPTQIDDSKLSIWNYVSLPPDIKDIQSKLGFNFSFTRKLPIEVSTDGLHWFSLPTNAGYDAQAYSAVGLALRDGGQIRVSYLAEMAGCPKSSNIFITNKLPKVNSISASASEWLALEKNRQTIGSIGSMNIRSFNDVANIVRDIPSCVDLMTSRASKKDTNIREQNFSVPVFNLSDTSGVNATDPCDRLSNYGILFLFKDFNCFHFQNSSEPTVVVGLNESCTAALGLETGTGFVTFTDFQLTGPSGTKMSDNLLETANQILANSKKIIAENSKYAGANSAISAVFLDLNSNYAQLQSFIDSNPDFSKLNQENEIRVRNIMYKLNQAGVTVLYRIKTYITSKICIKGKTKLTVTGFNPKCPKGFK